MKTSSLACLLALLTSLAVLTAAAQEKSPPVTEAEKEAAYAEAIEKRTGDIVVLLKIEDAAKSKKVSDIILSQYRLLRTRDDTIDAMLKLMGVNETLAEKIRADFFQGMTPPLHANFLTRLTAELTPDQIEIVKDKMTYYKVKVTYDAYCEIIPSLTDAQKAKILEMLKVARDEAIDGGSAGEKSRIFQKHKDQINAYLVAQGFDVPKAFKEFEAKQAKAEADKTAATTASASK